MPTAHNDGLAIGSLYNVKTQGGHVGGTWMDVQEAAQQAFNRAKENIDNPVYEIESAWKSGYLAGFKSALKTAGVPQQDVLDRVQAAVQQ